MLEATRLLEIELNKIEEPNEHTVETEAVIDESRQQLQNGNYKEHTNANKEIDEWLEE